MAVLSKISVGDIFFYEVDSKPTHSAPKGSVSIFRSDDATTIYTNNDGGTTWLKTIRPAYGEIYISDRTTALQWDNYTLGAFYAFDSTNTWISGALEGFQKVTNVTFGDLLRYTGSPTIRAVVKIRTTTRGGSTQWMEFEHCVAYDLSIIGDSIGGFHTLDNAGTNGISSVTLQEMNTNGETIVAFSPVRREGGGTTTGRTFINRHCQFGIYKIDEAIEETLFSEDWESGGFTENSWNVVNDTTNVWVVGQAENNTAGGTYAAYVSDDGGVNASYTINTSNISHFYKDFVIPSGSSVLTFDWKCQAENGTGATRWDYGTVVITDTVTTPAAGSEVSTTQAAAGGNGRIGADTNSGKFNLNYGTTPGTTWNTESINLTSYAGQTKRIVFTWVNDGSVGADPGFIIDNIRIKETNW